MAVCKKNLVSIFLTMVFSVTGIAWGQTNTSGDSLIPEDMIIEDAYQPGFGKSVGKTELVQGKVAIIHADQKKGYWAKEDLPLYKGDTLITEPNSRIRLILNDESILTLASKTKIRITRSVYEPKKKSRSSFLGMDLGKARFLVAKYIGFNRSEFKVKTKTAVAGVRGSDFIVEIDERTEKTTVSSLADTELEIQSVADLEAPPVIMGSHQKSVTALGGLPTKPVPLTVEEIQRITEDLIVGLGRGMLADEEIAVVRSEDEEERDHGARAVRSTDDLAGSEPQDTRTPQVVVDVDRVDPPELADTTRFESSFASDIRMNLEQTNPTAEVVSEALETITQTRAEDNVKEEVFKQLPGFPPLPPLTD